MDCLVTGGFGQCGTAIIDNLDHSDEYEFTYVNRSGPSNGYEHVADRAVTGDIVNYDEVSSLVEGRDAVIHLAALSNEGPWPQILESNIIGAYNVIEAAKEEKVETFVFASTNHVVGMYEEENAPGIYSLDSEVLLDHTVPIRPDSYYGTSKAFGEHLTRYYVENHEYPKQGYSLRICNVSYADEDHPYAGPEQSVADGEYERGSEHYERDLARMKAMWQSRRDFAHQVECCLEDDDVTYDVFNGVSDNDRRWFAIEHAREVLGYDPKDNAEQFTEPPT